MDYTTYRLVTDKQRIFLVEISRDYCLPGNPKQAKVTEEGNPKVILRIQGAPSARHALTEVIKEISLRHSGFDKDGEPEKGQLGFVTEVLALSENNDESVFPSTSKKSRKELQDKYDALTIQLQDLVDHLEEV